ncbi:MAG: extracellular solute-binding protein [Bacillota bacterium]|nr:extracellular solute-binding protein [Bacillota bacterium]
MKLKTYLIIGLSLFILLSGCSKGTSDNEIIVYTSVDQNIAETILDDFEKETGIQVKAVYDIEASKTTGLTNRLMLEKEKPQADVFWSSEIIMTLMLKDNNVFQKYISEKSEIIPDSYKDSEGYWTGFGGRARVMIINTDVFIGDEYPDSIYDLLDEKYKNYKKAIANPLFGTTLTHLFMMKQLWGEEEALDFFLKAQNNNTLIVDGNSVVRDLVASGEAAFGVTDTDDASQALREDKPVEVLYLDQGGIGTLVIPNTVGLIKDCKNVNEGKLFIDYLLDEKTESKLIQMGFIDVSLTDASDDLVLMECNFEKAYENSDELLNEIKNTLVR